MPCDQIQFQSVQFADAKGHEALLADALRTLGYAVHQDGSYISFSSDEVSGTYSQGQFSYGEDEQFDVDAVKVEFSKNVVRKSASDYGWDITELEDNKMQIRKRRIY